MKREKLIREPRKEAKARGVSFAVDTRRGKGSHFIVTFGDRKTTIQSGELSPTAMRNIKRQLGL